MTDAPWPLDRLARVSTDYLDDQTGDSILVAFHFDPDSHGDVKVSIGSAEPPFVEKGRWPAPGVPVVVRGSRYYQLLLEGASQSHGDRLQYDRGVVREVIEVEPEGAAGPTVRWVVGFVEPSCMALKADAGAARIELAIRHTLP